jgi:hypothetical protein
VDEPELNLNANLACRLWDTLEARLPEAVFVYATHCIAFAMRGNVEKILVLSRAGEPPLELGNISELDPEEEREFLGAIPAILAAPAALAVEGKATSFDAPFYQWLLGRPEVAVVPLENCRDVLHAVTRRGIWARIAPTARIGGVVDRDFRSDTELDQLRNSGIGVLEFHEAESYLCHPDIARRLADCLGTAEQMPTAETIIAQIRQQFEKEFLRVVASRVSERACVQLAVAVDRKEVASATDAAMLRQRFLQAARAEANKGETYVGEGATEAIFDEEWERCRTARDSGDVDAILRLMPAKELLNNVLAPRVGCRDAAQLLRGAIKHLSPTEFPALRALKRKMEALLERSD